MAMIRNIVVSPPLINTSCAWASDLDQLQQLFATPYTGAVTTRTATLDGFKENDSNAVAFTSSTISSINSYGYSPHPLDSYLSWIRTILTNPTSSQHPTKPFIISITASEPSSLEKMVQAIQDLRLQLRDPRATQSRIAIELNTSCPNIPDAPPAGYKFSSLTPLLAVLDAAYRKDNTLTVGLKLPPYVYKQQFVDVIEGLKSFTFTHPLTETAANMVAFFTCTNTLGNSLLFPEQISGAAAGQQFAVPTGLGGLAGDALHALALGNVYTFSQLLDKANKEDPASPFGQVMIIGAGGVTSKEARGRMLQAGAVVVGCATLLGKEGVRAFEILSKD